jgi:hypothetical protein
MLGSTSASVKAPAGPPDGDRDRGAGSVIFGLGRGFDALLKQACFSFFSCFSRFSRFSRSNPTRPAVNSAFTPTMRQVPRLFGRRVRGVPVEPEP